VLQVNAKYGIGTVVRHRKHSFRGVIFDVDPEFSNTDEWWQAIPKDNRPNKEQPFYHLLAENDSSYYVAYVSEQNLMMDTTGKPVEHPEVESLFGNMDNGQYRLDVQMN
jgi:heat shock protein HspQ